MKLFFRNLFMPWLWHIAFVVILICLNRTTKSWYSASSLFSSQVSAELSNLKAFRPRLFCPRKNLVKAVCTLVYATLKILLQYIWRNLVKVNYPESHLYLRTRTCRFKTRHREKLEDAYKKPDFNTFR